MPRRPRINWPLWTSLSLFLVLLAVYIGWPWLNAPDVTASWDMSAAEQVRQRGTSTVVSLWFFVLGASVGSFLNVVAYRLPLRLTIVSEGSRCPRCLQPILFRHNVPILGWLMLRARCRVCHLPISPRYVLVELLAGTIFLALFVTELASGGRSIPLRIPNRLAGVMWNVFTPQWDLIGLYFFHACLLSVLVVVALLGIDRIRVPKRLVVFSCFVSFGGMFFWPKLAIVPFSMVQPAWLMDPRLACVLTPLIGLVFGSLLGLCAESIVASKTPRGILTGDVAKTLAIVGVFIGWQGVVLSMLLTIFLHVISAWWRRGTSIWGLWVLVATTLMLCIWRQLSGISWLPGAGSSVVVHGFWIASVLVLLFLTEPFGPVYDESGRAPN